MKLRLSVLYFFQFAIWGCYLSTLGQFLGAGGLGKDISWFYAAIGAVSIITPSLAGRLADRFGRPALILGACHFFAAVFMLCSWLYASLHRQLSFGVFFPLYVFFLAFYMPTMALANTTSFGIIKSYGKQPVDIFPSIRVWGTVGFVAAMWFVNSTYWVDGNIGWTLSDLNQFASQRFQYNSKQLLCSGIIGIMTAIYSFILINHKSKIITESLQHRRNAIFNFGIIKRFFCNYSTGSSSCSILSTTGVFLIFVAFLGVCMQISNGFATPYISHFMGDPLYASSFAAGNATLLFSLSQISEALFIFSAGRSLKRFGIKLVITIGILAWGLRFLFLGIGNPEEGLIFLILSMIVYGVAFNFITIAGHLYIDKVSPEGMKGFGQGIMMLMSNGIGATIGIVGAGAIINHWCNWEMVRTVSGESMRLFMGEWKEPWFIFTSYTILLLICWVLFQWSLTKKIHR